MEDREVLLGHANYSMAGYYAGTDVGRLLQQANLERAEKYYRSAKPIGRNPHGYCLPESGKDVRWIEVWVAN
jgi:hypothetical protein